jgi:2-hydroxychromene-2-carboxylate isomerase
MRVRFFYDVVCPYAWMAATRIEAVAAEHGASVEWCPVLLGGVFRHHESPDVPAASWAPARAVLGRKDVHRMAALHGLPIRFPDAHPRRTVDAMRLCTAAPPTLRPAVSLALYQAIWVNHEDPADPAVLRRIAQQHGLSVDLIGADATRAALRRATAEAAELGVFGVPTMQVVHPDGSSGSLHWGADRLHFVASELAGRRIAQTHPVSPEATVTPPRRLDFFHDFASPYSYLGATQVEALATASGASIHWRPILLGALFREIGTPIVPLFAMAEAKRRWYAAELDRWATHHGVDFRFPSTFPVRTVLPLRVSLVEPSTIMPLYRALWVDDRDIGDPTVVADVVASLGLDAPAILEAATSPPIKNTLKDNTAAAVAAGVCGVPSFHVDHQHLVWGQDRLPLVSELLAGWQPAGEAQ